MDFHLNAVNLLEKTACQNCLLIKDWEVIGGNRLVADVQLTHPFPGLDKYTAFDVRGILITDSDYTFPSSNRKLSWSGENFKLIGPAGYTALFNPTEYPATSPVAPLFKYIPGSNAPGGNLTSTLCPFEYFGVTNERRMFPAGGAQTATYTLQLVPGPLKFGYAVDASWAPAPGEVTDPVNDFPSSANCMEASQIFVSIGKGLTPTGTASAKVLIEIYDWQGANTIDKVSIEAPDLFNGTIEASFSEITDEGLGAVYEASIQNNLLAPIGDYPLLVTVTDTEVDSNLGPVTAYQVTEAHVTLTGVWIRELIYIPAGEFLMGSDPDLDPQAYELEMPQHLHPTGEYYIGKYEISCAEIAGFVADSGYSDPQYWSPEGWDFITSQGISKPGAWNEWPEITTTNGVEFPDFAVSHMNWWEVEAFCNWAGGRLPSEAEWEKAARGTDGRIFPWGNDWDPDKCNHQIGWIQKREPVGQYSPEGDSPYGLSDCSGGVKEWCQDWFDKLIYEQYASGDFTPPSASWPNIDFRCLRGGDWSTTFDEGRLRTSDRHGREDNNGVGGPRIVFDL
jgi:formylglycine-generating enzyme required for sulfatase activity